MKPKETAKWRKAWGFCIAKWEKKKDNGDDDNKGNNESEMQKQTKAKQRKLKKS